MHDQGKCFLTKCSAGFNQGVSEKAVHVIINREDKPRRLDENNRKLVVVTYLIKNIFK